MSRRVLAALTPLAAIFASVAVFTGSAHATGNQSNGSVYDEVNGCAFTIEAASPGAITKAYSKLDLVASAGGNPLTGIYQGCGEKFGGGRVLSQVVCEVLSSPVSITPAADYISATAAITSRSYLNGSYQNWCYARFRYSDDTINANGTQKWGTEWRIPWNPKDGWGQPMTKEDQQKDEKTGFVKTGQENSFPAYDCGALLAASPGLANMNCMVIFGSTKTSDGSAGGNRATALKDAAKAGAFASLDAKENAGKSFFGGSASCLDLAGASAALQSQYAYDSANPNNLYCFSYEVWLYPKKSSN